MAQVLPTSLDNTIIPPNTALLLPTFFQLSPRNLYSSNSPAL